MPPVKPSKPAAPAQTRAPAGQVAASQVAASQVPQAATPVTKQAKSKAAPSEFGNAAKPAAPQTAKAAETTPSVPVSKSNRPAIVGGEPQPLSAVMRAHLRLNKTPGFVVSLLLHGVVLFLFSMIVIPQKDRENLFDMIIAEVEEAPEVNENLDETTIIPDNAEQPTDATVATQIQSEIVSSNPSPIDVDVSDAAPTIAGPDPSGSGIGGGMPQGTLAGRGKKARGALVASQGGTAASEVAVNTGLKWLAKHQKPDGSWSFKHGPDDPGAYDSSTGATGLALLAFLGGGHTHKSGDYMKQVEKGLAYLGTQMKVSGAGGDLRMPGEGQGMYTQGICTIALCEAYALSKDKNLRKPTQLAVDFIINAQDPTGGGWRYQPGQKGDTSVVGWQIMALKSAKIANLTVPNKTIGKATFFLNSVQYDSGAKYGYEGPSGSNATTAVGLLCRMYLGWTPKNPGLAKGVEFLGATGPQPGDIYFDYYATQVLHHWGGEPWTKWNNVMREYLVKSQIKEGDAAGSWPPAPGAAIGDAQGGRLYRTCMSVMTLEVYYRHLPLYQREMIKVDF